MTTSSLLGLGNNPLTFLTPLTSDAPYPPRALLTQAPDISPLTTLSMRLGLGNNPPTSDAPFAYPLRRAP